MYQKVKKKFQRHSRLYWIFFIIFIWVSIFVIGYTYFQNQTKILNSKTYNNLLEANRVYEEMPIWHKKIQTEQKIKIGMITDTHVNASLSYSQLLPIHNFVADMQKFQPNFVINLGDVIDGSHETNSQGMHELSAIKTELEKIGVPMHWVIGNHDLRAVTKEQFKKSLDLEALDQSFDIGDYRFIILDANYLKNGTARSPELEKRFIPGFLPNETLEWLKKKLATNKRVFVFMHQGSFNDRSVGDLDDDDDSDDYTYEEKDYKDEDWVKNVYKNKRSIRNVDDLRKILYEYRVDGVFNGHMEARRYQKNDFTAYYSLTGTRKSKRYPQSYYELTINKAVPDVTMFYKSTNLTNIVSMDFESENNIIQNKSTFVVDAAGLEWNGGDWIVVGGKRGVVFANNIRKYISNNELEGIAMCNQKYYIGTEKTNVLTILDRNFKYINKISLNNIDTDEVAVEGLACAENNGLFVVTHNDIYKINLNNGEILNKMNLPNENLSFADWYEGILYVVSKKNNIVLVIKNNKVIDRIPIEQNKKIKGIKASPQIINIIL